ncbi:MAG: hypothetical protein Q8L48_26865 [Archangium sp.]|nr:hypothetical protein [Archangium sp.]
MPLRSLTFLFLLLTGACARSICNEQGQPADSNPRSAAGVVDPTCPAYSAVASGQPPCAEPPEKRCVYRAMGDCPGAGTGACDVCADVVCGCSCGADAGCLWACGR